MADITAEQFKDAARRAYEAGDVATARRLIQRAQGSGGQQTQPEHQAEQSQGRTIMDAVVDNVVGRDDGVDSPGERIGRGVNEFAQSFFPGVARGAMELAGLPGTVADGMDWLSEKAGFIPEDTAPGNPLSGAALQGYADTATGGATEYRGETRAGRFGATVGEFLPGAAGGGARGLLAYGVLPGAASETAGQLTEGTAAEPYARIGAALGTGLIAGPTIGPKASSVRTPGASAEQRATAEALQAQGIQPTAGQISGSPMLRRMEGTATARPDQTAAVTRAAMRSLGSNADVATPTTLKAAQNQITDTMDDALSGVAVRPSTGFVQSADDVVKQYLVDAPSATVVPRVQAIADEIIEAGANPNAKPIDLSTLRTWRSAMGRLSQSNDEATRTAAQGLRRVIDGATDEALRAAGREADIATLGKAREQYRNFLAVSDASTRAGSEAGVLSPPQLNQSIIRTQGRNAYAIGRGTDLMETSRNAGPMLRSLPTVEAGGIRRLPGIPEAGATGLGAYGGYALGGLPGAAVGGLLGMTIPSAAQGAMRSTAAQQFMNNPQFVTGNAARTAPGLLAGN